MALEEALRRPSNGLPDGDCYVYALTDPADGCIYYVGKTSDYGRRLDDHLKQPGSEFLARWFAKLRRAGRKPVLRILQRVRACDVLTCEHDWTYWITETHSLLNIRNGQLPERRRRGRADTASSLAPSRGPSCL